MQEFNLLIVYLDVLYKNHIKNNLANKNKENRSHNHVTFCKHVKINWEKGKEKEKRKENRK